MRRLLMFLLFFNCLQAKAQTDEDSEPLMSPRILALDTVISVANRFNDSVGRAAHGYTYVFTDRSRPKTVMQVYKTENNETLKLEYKYTTDGGDSEDMHGKPVIHFQRITGDVTVIAKIYNYLFGTSIEPGQVSAVSTAGTEINYRGNIHQLILEPDDYAPGYWSLSFVR